MYALEKIKQEIGREIGKIVGAEINATDFGVPPKPELGDLSLPFFVLAKNSGKNPAELTKTVAASLGRVKFIANATGDGPYLNIKLDQTAYALILKGLRHDASFGNNKSGKNKRVMLEYANGNTHKEYHVGHLRNIAHGDAVNRILAANGFTSIPVSYINDFGIHVAKTLWYLLKTKPQMPSGNKGYFLGQLYSEATKALADNDEAKTEVGKIMQQIESRKGETYKLWKKTRQWSLDQMKEVNKELGVKFKTTFYENDFIKQGFKIVEELKAKGILIKSQGAIIADLEKYNLGVLVVVRSDGTGLYPVADLPLTIHKVKKYRLDTSLWVVDVRQGQYLHQLFKVLELYGLKAQLAHLPYEFVTLPSGMMSSRSGNVITYEELKRQAFEKTIAETTLRHEHWSKRKVEQVAKVLAFGALKFEIVKVGAEKIITFDIENALRFDGYTAAYLQYAYARIQSMQRKASEEVKDARLDFALLTEDREKILSVTLGRFPEIVVKAGAHYQPAEIAKYLFELTQLFNDYYQAVPILNDAKLPFTIAHTRLELAQAVAQVIKRGLNLLGIETVEEM